MLAGAAARLLQVCGEGLSSGALVSYPPSSGERNAESATAIRHQRRRDSVNEVVGECPRCSGNRRACDPSFGCTPSAGPGWASFSN